jgi:hypothetical protein
MTSVPSRRRLASIDHDAELRGDDHVLAPTDGRPAEQLLVVAGTIEVRGIEQGDAEVDGFPDHLDRTVVVEFGLLVEPAHPHAAQADPADLDPGCAEFPHLHPTFSFRTQAATSTSAAL